MLYEPFDQDKWLVHGPPFVANDPAVIAWEKAHGHDVRLKCYVEFGCQVIEPTLERHIDDLYAYLEEIAEAVENEDAPRLEIAKVIRRSVARHRQS
jgi:hypothetical protein